MYMLQDYAQQVQETCLRETAGFHHMSMVLVQCSCTCERDTELAGHSGPCISNKKEQEALLCNFIAR